MKKLAVLFMAMIMVFSMSACGSGSDGAGDAEMITVYIEIDYPDGCGEADVEDYQMQVPEGTNALEMLQLYAEENDIEVTLADTSPTMYVTSINSIAETDSAGWVYEVSDEMTMDAADQYIVEDGQEITWEYMSWSEMSV